MAIEKVSDEQRMLNALDRRSTELQVKIGDKRDAASHHRRTATAIDTEADELRDELNALSIARIALGGAS